MKPPLEALLDLTNPKCLKNDPFRWSGRGKVKVENVGKAISRRHRRELDNTNDPASYMDQMIAYLISDMPPLISEAVRKSEYELAFLLLKKKSQGWSIVVGSWADVAGEWLQNRRTIADFGGIATLYIYGFMAFYGLGFGLPLLLGLPKPYLSCGPSDFLEVLEEYELAKPFPVEALVRNYGIEAARTLINEFGTFVQLRLSCVLDREDTTELAADLLWAIEELVTALNIRVDLEENKS